MDKDAVQRWSGSFFFSFFNVSRYDTLENENTHTHTKKEPSALASFVDAPDVSWLESGGKGRPLVRLFARLTAGAFVRRELSLGHNFYCVSAVK